VAVDAAGNVFVADANNNAVKEIPVGGGAIITLGSGFKTPASVALDAADNVYVADFGNSAIKKIPAGGGAPITLASISTNTQGVAVDAAGNVYFGTVFGNQVKMIQAGTGALVNVGSGFSQPRGVAVDAAGNIYIADTGNNAIKEIPVGGGAIISLGSGFKSPEGVAINPAGNIYVGDAANATVKKIKPIGGYFINPVLPAGLSLDKSTGIISGTPTAASPATNYTVFAYNSSSSGSTAVNIKTLSGQTITFNALPAKTYGDADFAPGATSTSGAPALTYASDNTAVATIVNGNIHIVGAGTANITASQAAADSSHSAAADVKQQLTVNQAALTITANHQDMTQGRSVPTLTVHYDGFVNGDNSGSLPTLPSITTTGSSSSPPGTYPITASGAVAANYSISYVDGTLNITSPSSVATLGGLQVSDATLSPNFASTTTSYSAAVANSVTSVIVSPIPNNLNATITVNGTTIPTGSVSGPINLAVGANTITIVIVAEDGVTTVTYTVTLNRAGSADDNLSALTLSSGTLTPAFAPGTTGYTASVPNSVSTLTLTPGADDANATVKVNGAAVASGSASPGISLIVGPNTINTVVTAQDGVTKQTYTVTVTRAASANAKLSKLLTNAGVLTPGFTNTTTSYTKSVANSVTSIVFTPTAADPAATVTVNGTTVPSGTASAPQPLAVGSNSENITVTAANGLTKITYTITVTRGGSGNANLADLAISTGTLKPVFATGTFNYTSTVGNGIASVAVTPTTSDATATITVNGTAVSSGAASGAIVLNVGSNVITTKVTAQNGVTTKTYTLTITRSPSVNAKLTNLLTNAGVLTPGFINTTTSYTKSVANTVTSIVFTPTAADPTATIKVNGTAVTSGTASAPQPLAVGSNAEYIVVTAGDGVTTMTYTVAVTRAASATDATLANLAISNGALSPAFAQGTTAYTANVANSVTSITLTPTTTEPGATVQVNGTTVGSGTVSGAIALSVGSNVIITKVTAQNGTTTKTYTLTVTRAASSNANLAGLTLSAGTLKPVFAATVLSYTTSVGNGISSITVTPATADATATITVNGTAVTSGTASSAIALVVGANTINTVVTAQDGVTTQKYAVTVTRAASANAKLANLLTNAGALTPGFNNSITSYTKSVANSVTSIVFTPSTVDPAATVTVNNIAVTSGAASAPQPLAVGGNTENVKVTAGDGVTTITYTVTVTRAMGSANIVYEPVGVEKPTDSPQLNDDGINVHPAISPNGDGINDFLIIENIANYPDNKLQIMNRTGQLVFEAKNYDNSTKVFDGHSNKTGAMQLPGTYFYSLDYVANGISKHKTGFIVVKY